MGLAHETQPEMYGHPGFEFEDPIMVPFQLPLNSPLTTGWPSFGSCATSLHLHPCTAIILDHVRTMMETVLALPPDPTPEQLQHVSAVASWVHGRIGELPDNVPLYQPHQTKAPNAYTSSDTPSPPSTSESAKSSKGRSPKTTSSASTTASVRSSGASKGGESSPSKTESIDRASPPVDIPDTFYRMVRMTAIIYTRAVVSGVPTSLVCSDGELLQIWGLLWRIPLASRTTILGIFLWTLLAIAPSCHALPPGRFIRSFFVCGFLTAAVENWHVAIAMADAALKLQRWLQGSASAKGLVFGGETLIEKHGFAMKEALQNISTVHKGDNDREGEDDDDGDYDVGM